MTFIEGFKETMETADSGAAMKRIKQEGHRLSKVSTTGLAHDEESIVGLVKGSDLQAPHSEETGPRIKKPDYVVKIPRQRIKATGWTPYKEMIIQTSFPEDKWIKELEFIVKSKVLHHIVMYIDKEAEKIHKNHMVNDFGTYYRFTRMFSWVEGRRKYSKLTHNVGIKIQKGAKIFLEIHYEAIGREIIDDVTQVRFSFHKKRPKNQMIFLALSDQSIRISPEMSNYKSEMRHRIKEALLLERIGSHMHLRGKATSFFVIEPSLESKRILALHQNLWVKSPFSYSLTV